MSEQRICRVFPRLCMGGAENAIIQLLEQVGDTHMVVTHIDGLRAAEAKRLADRYTLLSRPRFTSLLDAMREAQIVHIHTINDHLLIPLAAQLSGAAVLLQTVHNHFSAQYCHFVEHSILVGDELMDVIVTPERSSVIPEGIPGPVVLPPIEPCCAPSSDRPLTLVEIRRADKAMRWTLAQLLSSGELDDLDVHCQVLGFEAESDDPRLQYMGEVANPYPLLAAADFLVTGTEMESFGRTVYEAMAWGTLPVAPPIDAFTRVFSTEQVCFVDAANARAAARQLRAHIERYCQDPAEYMLRRESNHRFVTERFGVSRMAGHTEDLYRVLTDSPEHQRRSFSPTDIAGGDIELFGAIVDDLLESTSPQLLGRIAELSGPMQGIIHWLLVDSGKARPDLRVAMLETARAHLGDRFILNLRLGEVLAEAGRFSDAVPALERARLAFPDNVTPVQALAEAWLQLGRRDQAAAIVRQGAQSNPSSAFLSSLADGLQSAQC